MSEQAANVLLPTGGAGGLALGAWALRRIGMPAERIGRRTVAFFLVTSSINFFAVIIAGVGLALGVLPGEAALGLALIPAVGAAAVLTAIVLLPRMLEGGYRNGGRGGRIRDAIAAGRGHLAGGIRDAISLLGSGRPSVTLGASPTWASTSRHWRSPSPRSAAGRRRSAPSCSPTRSASSAGSSRYPAASAARTAA